MKRKVSRNGFRRLVGLQFFADSAEGGAAAETQENLVGDTESAEPDAFAEGLFDEENEAPEEAAEAGAGGQEGNTEQPEAPSTQQTEEAEPGGAENSAEVPALPQTLPLTFSGRTADIDAAAVQSLARSLGISTRDAIVTLQKGMTYDHKNEREITVLQSYADASGMTLDQYIGQLEQQKQEYLVSNEMQRVAASLPEETPEEAIRKIAESNIEKQQNEQAQRAQNTAQQAAIQEKEQRIGGWQALFAEVPELQNPEKVPQELFQLVGQLKCSPTEAYYRYQAEQQGGAMEQLRGELEQTKTALAAAQKNQNNQQAAVGSMSTAGDAEGDAFLQGLMSGDY